MNIHPGAAIAIPLIVGAITSYIASKRGRSWTVWFSMGALFGLLATVVLLFLPKQKEKRSLLSNPEPATPLPNMPQKLWYYLDEEHKECGPISSTKLQEDLKIGAISHNTYVWNDEMDDWGQLADVLDIIDPAASLSE